MIRRLLSALSMLFLLPTTGCNIPVSQHTYNPYGPKYADINPTNQSVSSAGCSVGALNTPLQTWTETLQNDAVQSPVNVYWSAKSSGGSLAIYTALLPEPFKRYTSNAITAWYTALQNNQAPGSYVTLSPYETSQWQGAQVQMQTVSRPDLYDTEGEVDFGTLDGQGSLNRDVDHETTLNSSGTTLYIAGAMIYYNTAAFAFGGSDVEYYLLAEHEIGHALGNDHNPYKASVMYPAVGEAVVCHHVNEYPPVADMVNIENWYDPIYRTGGGGSGNGCRTTCTYVGRRPTGQAVVSKGFPTKPWAGNVSSLNPYPRLASISHARPPLMTVAGAQEQLATQRLIQRRIEREGMVKVMRSLHWVHGWIDGKIDYRTLSPESLSLASSIVARGHVTRSLAQTPIGARPSEVIQEFQIDEVLSANRMAGEAAKVGDKVMIADRYAYQDVPFVDDPVLQVIEPL